ncbi:hypothetical protein SprV_0100356200 [Sparganum proliferum]
MEICVRRTDSFWQLVHFKSATFSGGLLATTTDKKPTPNLQAKNATSAASSGVGFNNAMKDKICVFAFSRRIRNEGEFSETVDGHETASALESCTQ